MKKFHRNIGQDSPALYSKVKTHIPHIHTHAHTLSLIQSHPLLSIEQKKQAPSICKVRIGKYERFPDWTHPCPPQDITFNACGLTKSLE